MNMLPTLQQTNISSRGVAAMFQSLGLVELLCLAPIAAVTFLIPVATLLLVFLSYRRLERLEENIKRLTPPQL
jgi:hypothetical protein